MAWNVQSSWRLVELTVSKYVGDTAKRDKFVVKHGRFDTSRGNKVKQLRFARD